MMSIKSLRNRIEKIQAQLPRSEQYEIFDISLLDDDERSQLLAIQESLPANGTLRDVSDKQLSQLHKIALSYKERTTQQR